VARTWPASVRIADIVLARSDQTLQRGYSMSKQVREERNDCCRMLERT